MLMPAPQNPAVTQVPTVLDHRHRGQLLAGVLAIAVGSVAFARQSATVQVIGLLFGLNLLVTGLARAGLLLFVPGFPRLYRVLGVVFGVLTAIVGVLCLLHLTASAVVLLVFIAAGLLFDGLVQIFVAVGEPVEAAGGRRIATGLLLLLAAVALLVWPRLGPVTFVMVGAAVLMFAGIGHVVTAVAGLRADRRARA
jgi:uncharacterized membrane protein HdeD (DUF308 family)